MKREITTRKQSEFKGPVPPKSVEREFSEVSEYMIDQMGKQFKNQVLLELNKGTIEKFTDSQAGNFATIYLKLANQVKRKILKRFSNDRLNKVSKKYTGKVNKTNSADFYSRVESKSGISKKLLEETEGLTSTINAYQLETTQWIQKLRDDTLQEWTAATLRSMSNGDGLDDILSQFDGMREKRKNHAKMVARTQITSFNSLASKARAQNLGITKAIWVTSHDERVRESHRARNGKEFDVSEGLYSSTDGKTLLPGTDYQCRCDYRFIIPEE